MGHSAASTPTAPSRAVSGGRGRPQLVHATTAVAVVVEAQCFARDVIDGATRIQTMAATGDRARLVHEAGRLGQRATAYHAEFARLAAEIES